VSLLTVADLRVHLFTSRGVIPAVDGISFQLSAGQALGIVGESGCGKTMTALSVMRLLPSPPARVVSGTIRFHDEDLLSMPDVRLREIRGGSMAMIYQDPQTSLNPVFTIGEQIAESVRLHRKDGNAAARVRLSASTLRRHAATRGHRHGAGMRPHAADRR
jgi:peptide/nickel transport system ATP-binding protein